MRVKHNKKRNTAFLYEVLVKNLTIATIKQDKDLVSEIKQQVLNFFGSNKLLGKELKAFRNIYESNKLDVYTAQRLIAESRKDFDTLDRTEIFNEQTKLINWMNKRLGQEVFNQFVPNYRTLASIAQIFNKETDTKSRVLLERNILGLMLRKPEIVQESKLEPLDNLSYKTYVGKFNDKYGDLLQEQKELINNYVMSFQDQGATFRLFVYEELERIKHSISNAVVEESLKEHLNQTLALVESFKNKPLSEETFEKILKLQSIVKEIE
jgi:hypothetical protein